MQTWKSTIALIFFTIIFPFIINGCTNSSGDNTSAAKKSEVSAAMEPSQKPTQTGPVFAVIGIDISGSNDKMTSKALIICKNIIMNAAPGNEYIIRTISAESYPPMVQWKTRNGTVVSHNNTVAHAKFTDVPEAPNRFNRQARRRYLMAQKAFQTQKLRLSQKLDKLTFESAPQTDIYGFIQAASDQFATAPAGTRKVLFFATDLKNTSRLTCKPNLSDVEVIVFEFLVDADPVKTLERRDAWVERLQKWGATKVTIRPAN